MEEQKTSLTQEGLGENHHREEGGVEPPSKNLIKQRVMLYTIFLSLNHLKMLLLTIRVYDKDINP
jgi:hypothetical protein